MTLASTSLPDGLSLVRAGAADNEAILSFMSDHGMAAGMSLRFDRAPDYFALHNAHSPDYEVWLLRRGREILGIASFVLRKAWINGAIENCVYLADLRFARDRRAAGLWRTLMCDILLDIHARTGARYAYSSILRDNHSGRNALLRARSGDITLFNHLRGYSTVSIVARKPFPAARHKGISVRQARVEDEPMLRDFVAKQSGKTDFGPVFDESSWRRRTQGWPDFCVENFYIAFDDRRRLLGCIAPWDSSSINRIVIDGLSGSAEFVRRVCNLLSPLTGRPRVNTGAGSRLPDISLTHVFIEGRLSEVFSALLRAAAGDVFATGHYATISLCVYDDDPLAPALDEYWHVSVPMDLYWTDIGALAGGQCSAGFDGSRYPGFESYLV